MYYNDVKKQAESAKNDAVKKEKSSHESLKIGFLHFQGLITPLSAYLGILAVVTKNYESPSVLIQQRHKII